jgi:hypothetical protein
MATRDVEPRAPTPPRPRASDVSDVDVRVMSETALHARVFRRRAGFKIALNPKPETSRRPRRSDQTPVPIEPCFSHSQRVQGFGV